MLRLEIQLDTGQFLIRGAIARLPDQLKFSDGSRRSSTDTDDEELSERQRPPRGAVEPRGPGRVSVIERSVERVRTVMTTRRSSELTNTVTHRQHHYNSLLAP